MELETILKSLIGNQLVGVRTVGFDKENDCANEIHLFFSNGEKLVIDQESFEDGDSYDPGCSGYIYKLTAYKEKL